MPRLAASSRRQELGEAVARHVGIVAEQAVLERRDPAPDAEIDPPARELVEHADLLDEPDGMVQRQARDEQAEAQVLGLARDGGEERHLRRRRRERVAVVLGDVVAAEAGGVRLAQERDASLVERLVPGELLGDWRAALRGIAHHTRDTFVRHPWLIDTVGRRPLVTANQLRHVEQSIAVVANLDVDPAIARAMVLATDDYTIGYAFRRSRIAHGFGGTSGKERARLDDLLATGEFPRLAEVLSSGRALLPLEDTFETGLELLFDGMQAMVDAGRG